MTASRFYSPPRRLPFLPVWGLLLLLAVAGCRGNRDVVATVGSQQITRTELDALRKNYQAAFAHAAPLAKTAVADLENLLLSERIEQLLLIQEGRRRGLTVKDSHDQTAFLRATLSALGREVAYPSYQEALSYYRQHPREFTVPRRYQVTHLLLGTEHQAWEIREKIAGGKMTMAAAARRFSRGAAASRGGRLLPMSLEDFLPEISKVLARLAVGQLSQVIHSPYGYHLVRLEKSLPAGTLPFEQVENQIKDELYCQALRRHLQEWLTAAKKQAKITVNLPAAGQAATRSN
ncbi:MAG: peptidyl-prolyl cis-trans isomerase [Deltaproteobacteria bacterium]|nr:peptidyl-prolyl cis-trans isomerase [Deltaproteobacteria bacterium]